MTSSPDKESSSSNTTDVPLDMQQPVNQATTASETTIQQPANEDSSYSNSVSPIQTIEQKQLDGRAELIARARSFLVSPQVQLQDTAAKRSFLAEKGLNEVEIEELLRNLVRRFFCALNNQCLIDIYVPKACSST